MSAKAVRADAAASQEALDAAASSLLAAFGKLEYGVQKLHLETAIKAAEAILALSVNYEDTSALAAAVEAGKEVLDEKKASQEEVDSAAYESLTAAAEDLLDGKYPSETLATLKKAIENAQAVLADPDRAQSDISDAYAGLVNAIMNLEMKGNKAALKAVIEKANEVLANREAYVASSIAGLEEAVAQAQKVYEDDNLGQNEVNEAVKTLTRKVADARLLGDVDGDGKITTGDTAEVLRASAELRTLSEKEAKSADVNGDGIADTKDAVLILQYTAEKITGF